MGFRLSAITCAYNEEKLLPAALHSLFAQTRLPDEVIVVNDTRILHGRLQQRLEGDERVERVMQHVVAEAHRLQGVLPRP